MNGIFFVGQVSGCRRNMASRLGGPVRFGQYFDRMVDRVGKAVVELQPATHAVGDNRLGSVVADFFHQRLSKVE